MKIQPISFAKITPKNIKERTAYNKALEELLEHSDKDYKKLQIAAQKHSKPINTEEFIKRAREFFQI